MMMIRTYILRILKFHTNTNQCFYDTHSVMGRLGLILSVSSEDPRRGSQTTGLIPSLRKARELERRHSERRRASHNDCLCNSFLQTALFLSGNRCHSFVSETPFWVVLLRHIAAWPRLCHTEGQLCGWGGGTPATKPSPSGKWGPLSLRDEECVCDCVCVGSHSLLGPANSRRIRQRAVQPS